MKAAHLLRTAIVTLALLISPAVAAATAHAAGPAPKPAAAGTGPAGPAAHTYGTLDTPWGP